MGCKQLSRNKLIERYSYLGCFKMKYRRSGLHNIWQNIQNFDGFGFFILAEAVISITNINKDAGTPIPNANTTAVSAFDNVIFWTGTNNSSLFFNL